MSEQGEARSVALVVRLTPAERDAWHAAARAAGRGKTASWVREVVSERAVGGPTRAGSGADGEVARVRAELARIGNNLNQLTHQANAGALGGPRLEYGVVLRALETTRAQLGAIRDALRERVAQPAPVPAPEPAPAPELALELGLDPSASLSEQIEALRARIARRPAR